MLYPVNGSDLAGGAEIDLEGIEAAEAAAKAARTVLLAPAST